MTCYAHLARALVKTRDILTRAQAIAISGYSGIDGFLTFPLGIPHVHFNTWHNSFPTDSFPFGEHSSLWKSRSLPSPYEGNTSSEKYIPSLYDESAVNRVIKHCITPKTKNYLSSINCPSERAVHTIIEMNYYPTKFPVKENLYVRNFERILY